MCRFLLCFLSIVMGAVSSGAQCLPADHDAIIISVSDEYPCLSAYVGLFVTHDVYLIIVNPTRPVASFECELRIESDCLYFGSWGAADGWTTGVFDQPLYLRPIDGPATGEFIVAAVLQLTVADVGIPIEFFVDPPEHETQLAYQDPDGLAVSMWAISEMYDMPDAHVNPYSYSLPCCYPAANENRTWSTVKSLYR
jgi:hypothetical protein